MLTSEVKRLVLPFSTEKSRFPFSSEVEAAAVFTIAEFERGKGGGLINWRPEEKLVFLAKIGYPLWLFPKKDLTHIFDGLNDSTYSIHYAEFPSTKVFMESLEVNSRPRENYVSFLSDHHNYFQQYMKEQQFTIRGLIADSVFKNELIGYRKEAKEATDENENSALLYPTLEETTITSMLTEFDRLQSLLREDAERLPECLRLIKRTTSQYITEIDYEATAAKEEFDAKIRAQEEVVNPQIAKLNKDYKRKIKDLTDSFDQELANLEKLRAKTKEFVESDEEKIKLYQSEAKAHARKKHLIYEKRWKGKIKRTEKELNGLKKELKNTENKLKKLSKQRNQEVSRLNFELDSEVKLARQPLLELEAARDAKAGLFKQETDKLILQEKPVVEGLNKNIRLREAINANFEMLGIKDQQLKSPTLFYVPFYAACYQVGLTKRYLIIPPSMINGVDFSAKLKGALGMSKIKELLTPRFKAITALIERVQVLIEQNSVFEQQLGGLAEKSNLLKTSSFLESVEKGLVYLKHEGWLSDKEQQVLSKRLTYA